MKATGDDDSQNHDIYFHRLSHGSDSVRAIDHNTTKGIIASILFQGVIYGSGSPIVDLGINTPLGGSMADVLYGAIAQLVTSSVAATNHQIAKCTVIDVNTIRIMFESAPVGVETADIMVFIIGQMA